MNGDVDAGMFEAGEKDSESGTSLSVEGEALFR